MNSEGNTPLPPSEDNTSLPPLVFSSKTMEGNVIDQHHPNDAWETGLPFDDPDNDRWRFQYGKQGGNKEGGWAQVVWIDIHFNAFIEHPVLKNVYCHNLTTEFTINSYKVSEFMGTILIDGYVVPIQGGYVFVYQGDITTAFVFVADSDRRLDDIMTMRNKRNEIMMDNGMIPDREDLLRSGNFYY